MEGAILPGDIHQKGGRMSLNNKQKKKLTRFVRSAEDRLKMLMLEQTIKYFCLFVIVLFWDKIAQTFYIRYSPGINFGQIVVAGVCLIQTVRYARKVR